MCGYKIDGKGDIWRRLGPMLHHYIYLQIAKINDPKNYHGDDNFSLEYFVARVNKASYVDSYGKFRKANKEFIEAINKARNKVITHRDWRVFNSPDGVGAFSAGLDEKYFNSLHEIISEGYKELDLGLFPEWPQFIANDTKFFMDKMLKIFNA